MNQIVKIIECPRDAWQGLPKTIPSETKADYLRKLLSAGFKHIDAVSFVSAAAVPQMADSEQVLSHLMLPADAEIIGIAVNERGAERAVQTGQVKTIGFPYSISPEFLSRNQRQTPEQALHSLRAICSIAESEGRKVVAYISMAFGNPYGELWSVEEVLQACDLIIGCGVTQISLADTSGIATPEQIAEVLSSAISRNQGVEIGAHLHARPDQAAEKIRSAFGAGCRRFDSAMGGLGGCPFAQDELVGNIPTEILLAELRTAGVSVSAIGPLESLIDASREISNCFGSLTHSPSGETWSTERSL
jgi:hydroxymethylglutaryl-CoA lyase